MKRQASHKPFIEQPAARNKFGSMRRVFESLQACTEQLIYEFEILSDADGARLLGDSRALLKAESGMVCKYMLQRNV